MSATLIAAKGQAAPNAAGSSLAVSITSSTSLSALIAAVFAGVASTQTFSSSGSTWTNAYTDATKRTGASAIPAQAGTTTVTADNAAVNADFTAVVAEFAGLKTGGATQANTRKNSTTNAWDTDSLLLTQDSLVVCVCVKVDNSSGTSSTTGSGFSEIVGTGLTSGGIANASEGNVMHVSWGNFLDGATVTGAGTWSSNTGCDAWLMAFELEPAASTRRRLVSKLMG